MHCVPVFLATAPRRERRAPRPALRGQGSAPGQTLSGQNPGSAERSWGRAATPRCPWRMCLALGVARGLAGRRPRGTFKRVVPSVVGAYPPPVADKGPQPELVLLGAVALLVLKRNTSAVSGGREPLDPRRRGAALLPPGVFVGGTPRCLSLGKSGSY